jgi:hypothetical protein
MMTQERRAERRKNGALWTTEGRLAPLRRSSGPKGRGERRRSTAQHAAPEGERRREWRKNGAGVMV